MGHGHHCTYEQHEQHGEGRRCPRFVGPGAHLPVEVVLHGDAIGHGGVADDGCDGGDAVLPMIGIQIVLHIVAGFIANPLYKRSVVAKVKKLRAEFPAEKAGLQVLITDSEAPYHERKVTLLNGPHTVLSPVAFLSGVNIVRDACNHPVLGKYIHKVQFDELMQTLNLPMEELQKFGADVLERFNNPYVDHQVTSIMLNSFPKYQTRDLPGLKVYLERKGELPKGLVLGLAAPHHLLQGRQA